MAFIHLCLVEFENQKENLKGHYLAWDPKDHCWILSDFFWEWNFVRWWCLQWTGRSKRDANLGVLLFAEHASVLNEHLETSDFLKLFELFVFN